MANAEVSDDVIDVDPTCDQLQELTAEMLGKEAAIFMPSGTMTNQVGVRIHCKPGDEFICEAGCHIYNYEQGPSPSSAASWLARSKASRACCTSISFAA